MTEVLVIVHLSSLDSYSWHARTHRSECMADALGRDLADAVRTHAGPIIVVDQAWPLDAEWSHARRAVLAAIVERADAVTEHFDEATEYWAPFRRRLWRRLTGLGATKVRLAGVWWDDALESGCVSEVFRFLRSRIETRVDHELVGSEDDFER